MWRVLGRLLPVGYQPSKSAKQTLPLQRSAALVSAFCDGREFLR